MDEGPGLGVNFVGNASTKAASREHEIVLSLIVAHHWHEEQRAAEERCPFSI